jgi:hypothetical protein
MHQLSISSRTSTYANDQRLPDIHGVVLTEAKPVDSSNYQEGFFLEMGKLDIEVPMPLAPCSSRRKDLGHGLLVEAS